MSDDVLEALGAFAARGERAALATVVGTRRSAPRPPGAKMAIGEHGEIAGAVSGGCVEGAVVEVGERVIAGEPPRLLRFGISDEDAWEVGLQCGGEIDVWVDLVADGPAAAQDPRTEFLALARAGARAALVTMVRGPSAGARMLVTAAGEQRGTFGDVAVDAAALRHAEELMWAERSELREEGAVALFVDVTAPAPRLIVFGAVDYAASLCRLARFMGWRPYVVDPRARFVQPSRFPEAEAVVAAWPEEAFETIGGIDRATAIVVLTHDPKLDDAALRLALTSPAAHIGAMGSRRAQAARRERLLAAGIDEGLLARLSAPVGLDLGALTPEETALSIIGEIVALRHGRAGGRLTQAPGRIHALAS
jgi:xanthine dehydrogenase accessory factor